MRPALSIMIVGLAVVLSGCAPRGLMDIRSTGEGPDEFLIMPAKPLEMPQNLAALPPPTPGGTNRTDQNPVGDAMIALGGRPSEGGVPSADAALVTQVSRYGVEPNIRTSLAESDAEFRRRQSRGTRIRLFPVDRYSQAYRREALNPFEQTAGARSVGLQTPTSPPP